MTESTPRPARRRFLLQSAQVAAAGTLLATVGPPAQATLAGARGLAMRHTHTREQIDIVYALDQRYDTAALGSLNHFLRDHYTGDVGAIDPGLFDLLHRLRQVLGRGERFEVISGYRCPTTNVRLRQTRGGGVAQRSLHVDGRAIDVRLPGVALADLRDAARSLQAGGVGFYPREAFVHLDTGRVRHW